MQETVHRCQHRRHPGRVGRSRDLGLHCREQLHQVNRDDIFLLAVIEQTLQRPVEQGRSEEHTSELQSLMRISYAVFCLKKKKKIIQQEHELHIKDSILTTVY